MEEKEIAITVCSMCGNETHYDKNHRMFFCGSCVFCENKAETKLVKVPIEKGTGMKRKERGD